MMDSDPPDQEVSPIPVSAQNIAIIGAGTIGLSIAALHIPFSNTITIYDSRPDLEEYVHASLPALLSSDTASQTALRNAAHVQIGTNLEEAVKNADVIQESCPEVTALKQALWQEIESLCQPEALLWSSTSGIPASIQSKKMKDPSRLIVVHPYNPPHIMPLLEIVPGPETKADLIDKALKFWKDRGRRPVVVKKEMPGFVANRLAFALLREAIHLVSSGVVSVKDLDAIVEASMGPRWAVAGPFKSFAAGGGEKGLMGLFEKIGSTVENCWQDQGNVHVGGDWQQDIFGKVQEAYGMFGKLDAEERNAITIKVLESVRLGKADAERKRKELEELEKLVQDENLD